MLNEENAFMLLPTMVNIKAERKYWMVRTQSGEYYDEFYHDNFVAINWDEFNDFTAISSNSEAAMVEQIRKAYPDEKRPGHTYKQIRRFVVDIQVGDIVLIPSKTHISIGEITSDVYIQTIDLDDVLDDACPFQKRRDVQWIKTLRRDEVDPYLFKLLNSHHTITDASEYAPYIDRTLHSFFVKGDNAHLVLRVTTQEKVLLKDLAGLLQGSIECIETFNEVAKSSLESDDLEIRLNVQSPGPVEWISDPYTITVLGLIFVFFVGGKFKMNFSKEKTSVDVQTEGFIEKMLKVLEFLQKRKRENKQMKLEENLQRLKVQMPKELEQGAEMLAQAEDTKNPPAQSQEE